jgi:hypothetical protein
MNKNLNNELSKIDIENIEKLCFKLDQKHPMERKIKFLLDIRGYIKVNNIQGSYFEFGSFKSQMQYSAFKILKETKMVNFYVGLDTFKGEPKLTKEESESLPCLHEGSFTSNFKEIKSFVDKNIGSTGILIKGDFRKKEILKNCNLYTPISIAVIDCNLISSISASLDYIIENVVPGAVLFIDDFYTNFGKGDALINNLINKKLDDSKYRLIDHGFYPPFAKSFIIAKKYTTNRK